MGIDLGFKIPFSNKKKQGSLEKYLILHVGQGKYKMSMEHLIVPESKEMLKKKYGGMSKTNKKKQTTTKSHRSQPERAPAGQK